MQTSHKLFITKLNKPMIMITSNKILIVFALSALASCGQKQKKETHVQSTIKVTVQEITAQDRPEVLNYSGSIEADNTVSLGFTVAGRVTAVNVLEGQQVQQGQLLATVETDDYASALQIAKAAEEQAADNFKRLNELHAKGSLPERDYIAARSALSQAEANVRLASKRLADTRLYAPFAGIISAKLIDRGASAAPGMPAFTILKTDQVYAKAPIAESEISKLIIGREVLVIIPALNDSIKGKVTIINPQADNSSRTYTVKVRLGNSNKKLLPGMLTEMKVYTGSNQQNIVIPAASIVRDADDLTYVFVANQQNKAIRRRITASGVTTNNEVIVQSGLQAGDKLIVNGQTRLEDGSSIQLETGALTSLYK
jgi:RND family efflux transporter MFP subunit